MSQSTQSQKIPFLLTPEHPCPYLENKTAKTLFLSPEVEVNPQVYSGLIKQGLRRSGEQIYLPYCDNCQACISVRIPVEQFQASRSQKRCLNRMNQFRFEVKPANYSQENFELFQNYIKQRHKDSDMYPTSEKQFREFLLCEWIDCYFLNFICLADNRLVATAVFDKVDSGLSAVYTYFDSSYEKYSLGKMAILYLIELTKNDKLDYLYLGYWIKECQKMTYKSQYRPIQCFINKRWTQLN